MNNKATNLSTADKELKKFLKRYCTAYQGTIADLAALLQQMGIPMPTKLKDFNKKTTFFTATGEEIRLSDDIEDYIAIVTVKKENVEKVYQCFLPQQKAELQSVEVTTGEEKIVVFLGNGYSEIETPDAKMKIIPNDGVINYLRNLSATTKASDVLTGVCARL